MKKLIALCAAMLSLAGSYAVHAADSKQDLNLFVGQNEALAKQLWQTDGTANGTKIFTYLNKDSTADANPYPLGTTDKYAIFAAFTPETGQELWRTDGSTAGTELIKDLVPGAASGLIKKPERESHNSLNLKGKVLFWSQTTDQLKLMSTDGNAAGTEVLKTYPISLGINTFPPNLYSFKDLALFYVDDGQHGLELWQTDGSSAGTQLVVDASNDQNAINAYTNDPIQSEQALYFLSPDQRSSDPMQKFAQSIWRTDGKSPERVARIPEKNYATLVAANEQHLVWVQISEQDQDVSLWQYDFSTKQAQVITHIKPDAESGTRSLSSAKAVFFKDQLYLWFITSMDQNIDELWRTDFSANGTERLARLPSISGEYRSEPIMFEFADRLYFFLSDGIRMSELWMTDGSVAGTKTLLKVKDDSYPDGVGDSWPARPTPYVLSKDKLIFPTFSAKDPNLSQLWSLRPEQPEQPELLGEFSDPLLLPPTKTDSSTPIYFLSGKERWQTDGSQAGTKSLGSDALRNDWQPTAWPSGGLNPIVALSNESTWLITHQDPATGQEFWVLSTDPSQSKVLKDINTSPASSEVRNVVQVADNWYFTFNSRLWMTGADPMSKQEVSDIPNTETISYNAYPLVAYQDSLFVVTEDTNKANTLWQVSQGKAKKLKTVSDRYLWLFPSREGVYVAAYASQTDDAATLDLYDVKSEQFKSILAADPKKRRLLLVTETEQGLFYIFEPNHAAEAIASVEPSSYSLWLHPKAGEDKLIKEGFQPVAVTTDMLSSTHNYAYFIEQAPNELLNYQPWRLDPKTAELVKIAPANLPTQSRLLAAEQGVFILETDVDARLWWLADSANQATLIKTFTREQAVQASKVLGNQLYLQVQTIPTSIESARELWVSDGTSEGTRKLKDDLEQIW
jgi:ELWxxDGT repeat protein